MTTDRTSSIGPYRLEDRLGTGGMGEVWRAHDERLDRSVAVKLIRPESAEDQTARERFRREARAAAALTHPSVVRIYDVIESGEGDAIVMELVEGEPLARRIARGPLPLEEAVRLGRQIAEGLAAAHRRGILHRDLKAENVVITPDGEAKVLDFGLAKRLDGATEDSLTRTTGVVGTFRTMSPEQARGLALDSRSDLFSLGILLYEMSTGSSPFKAETPLDTMQRICTARQVPVQELRLEAPSALSALVDELLEKDPSFRPADASTVAARLEAIRDELRGLTLDNRATVVYAGAPTAGPGPAKGTLASRLGRRKAWAAAVLLGAVPLLAVLGWGVQRLRRPPLVYVAVLKPEVAQGSGDGVEAMAAGLRGSLLSGLLALDGVRPLPPEQVDPITGSPREVGRATAAGEVVASQLSCGTEVCQISLHRLRTQDGILLWAKTFSAPIDRPYLLVDAVQGVLAQGYSGRRLRGGEARLEAREEDYAEFLRLYQSFDTRREEELSAGEILDRLARLRQTSPRFLEVPIFESYVLQHRFRTGRDRRDLDRAYEVLEQARKLAPDDPRPLFSLFEVAFLGGDLERAEGALDELERLQPGDARLLASRARLLDRQGGHAEEVLALMRQATERLPSWRHFLWMAEMESSRGMVVEARSDLEELLRRSPGNATGESVLAQLELFYGSPKRAVDIYERLVRRSPQFTYLSNLGSAQFLLGRLPQAEQSFRRAADIEPGNPIALLNLADTRLLQNDRRGADDLYRKALQLAGQDATAGSNWQISSIRAQALAHLGHSEEAVVAIQEALRLAPTNPQVAYEAAVVYVLVGDRTSALLHAKRALRQGIEARWLTLPWFDSLRPALGLAP